MLEKMILNEIFYFGRGSVKNVTKEIDGRKLRKGLIITSASLEEAGIVKKLTELLDDNGNAYNVFTQISEDEDPTVELVQKAMNALKYSGADYVIGLGGGPCIDCAKAVSIIAQNPDFSDVASLEGKDVTKYKGLPMIAIPTMVGTGSEATINYVIEDDDQMRKLVCVDAHDIPEVAIIDQNMVEECPPHVFAAASMDALTHAIEGYITRHTWIMTDMFCMKAIDVIANNLRPAMEGDPDAIEEMLIAQYVASMGCSNVGLGAVHAMAHPVCTFYDVRHGLAHGVLLPYVMEHNQDVTGNRYAKVARALGVRGVGSMTPAEYRIAAVQAVRQLATSVGIPTTLAELGVREDDLRLLAEAAYLDVYMDSNPKDMSVERILGIYKWALHG